jgi:hypothetical protein
MDERDYKAMNAELKHERMTAVEWLYETLWKQNDYSLPSNILEQAKEIEKQQIIDASETGNDWDNAVIIDGEDYYEKTFKNTKE